WARSGDAARFDAVFRRRNSFPDRVIDYRKPDHDRPAIEYANTPAIARIDESGLIAELREQMRDVLPAYMMPSAFVTLDALPLTPNGKIDRNALPAPSPVPRAPVENYAPPANDIESKIAAVWKALLGVERVGVRDNIFDLGANSLLTVQANQRLSSLLQRKIPLVSMFRYPTVEALAIHLGEANGVTALATERTHERAERKREAVARRRELRDRK